MPTSKPERSETELPGHVASTERLGAVRFAPTVAMPGGGTVTPEGWMWVLGFALAGCEWAIEAAERDNLHERAMDYRRRQRIYWQQREVDDLEARLAALEARLADEKAKLTAMQAPNVISANLPQGDELA